MCVTDFSLLYSLSKKTKFQIKKKGNIGARESKLEKETSGQERVN